MAGPTLGNVAQLLFQREIGTRGGAYGLGRGSKAAARELERWHEGDALRHCSAEYAHFQPAPRSTIALCYNCDGTLLASSQ